MKLKISKVDDFFLTQKTHYQLSSVSHSCKDIRIQEIVTNRNNVFYHYLINDHYFTLFKQYVRRHSDSKSNNITYALSDVSRS